MLRGAAAERGERVAALEGRHDAAVADRHAKGRVVSLLEGGYALSALGRSVVQHVRVLAGLN